jgi:hypothetical protein
MFWIRTDYEPPSPLVVALTTVVGVALILTSYVSLGVFVLVAFFSLTLYNWAKSR